MSAYTDAVTAAKKILGRQGKLPKPKAPGVVAGSQYAPRAGNFT
jgi:hypothetical protein